MTRDKTGVKRVWELHCRPCFSIWETAKNISFSCCDEAEEDREKMLDEYLAIIQDSTTANIYTIKFHEDPKSGKINNGSPVTGSVPFRLNEERAMAPNQGGGNMDFMNQLFNAKLETLQLRYDHAMEKKEEEIQTLAAELAEEEEEEEEQDMGTIGNILKLPEKYPSIKEPFEKVLHKLTEFALDLLTVAKHKTNQVAGAAINGVPAQETDTMKATGVTPDVQLNNALAVLRDWYVNEYGGLLPADATQAQKEAKFMAGFKQLASDMTMLAALTKDDDAMHLALKKLRSF